MTNRPSVDPANPDNAKFVEGKNTEACEQLNSWISKRTDSVLELTPGKFGVFWWSLFADKNKWTETTAKAARSGFAKGCRKDNPDELKQ